MLPYKSLIQLKRGADLALHIQICNAFITYITNGTLLPSSALPSSRILADLIGVNRNTVKLAYEELINQGWAESVARKGIFVIGDLPLIPKNRLHHHSKEKEIDDAFVWNNDFEMRIPRMSAMYTFGCVNKKKMFPE